MSQNKIYSPKHKVRVVTAASLFDGHDASINIMRRILQATGCEVIHLGHDRSVEEIVSCAIQEDANAIAITSYQGGHMEYFMYMYDLLKQANSHNIKIFGGGGGTILPEEIQSLHRYGITKIYHPDDGREMGLQGMINDVVLKSDFSIFSDNYMPDIEQVLNQDKKAIGRSISIFESGDSIAKKWNRDILKYAQKSNRGRGISTNSSRKQDIDIVLVRKNAKH